MGREVGAVEGEFVGGDVEGALLGEWVGLLDGASVGIELGGFVGWKLSKVSSSGWAL